MPGVGHCRQCVLHRPGGNQLPSAPRRRCQSPKELPLSGGWSQGHPATRPAPTLLRPARLPRDGLQDHPREAADASWLGGRRPPGVALIHGESRILRPASPGTRRGLGWSCPPNATRALLCQAHGLVQPSPLPLAGRRRELHLSLRGVWADGRYQRNGSTLRAAVES